MNRAGIRDSGFEVNTDVALVNPDWLQFAGSHDQRFGLAISHLKSQIRGRAYDNEAMRVRVARNGYYVQSRQFPAAFFGDLTTARVRFIGAEEADAISWEAVAHYRSGEAESLTRVHSVGERPDFFFGYRFLGHSRYEYGTLQAKEDLHLRVMLASQEPLDLLGGERRGVVILQRLGDDRNVLVTAPGRRQPFGAGGGWPGE